MNEFKCISIHCNNASMARLSKNYSCLNMTSILSVKLWIKHSVTVFLTLKHTENNVSNQTAIKICTISAGNSATWTSLFLYSIHQIFTRFIDIYIIKPLIKLNICLQTFRSLSQIRIIDLLLFYQSIHSFRIN